MNARPLLLGHRGARARRSIPENTFDSFDQALADGCDGFEFDIRLTADKQGVVCHDEVYGKLRIDQTESARLSPIPMLEAVLQRYQKTAFLDVELKVPGLEQLTCALLRKYPPRAGCVISSFLPEVLRQLKNTALPLGLICETRQQLAAWHREPTAYLMAHHKLLTRELMDRANIAKARVFVWTVNRTEDMRRFAKWGVAGIISDDTAKLVAAFRKI